MGWNITKQTSTPASLSKHTVARGAAAQSNIMMDEDTDEEPTPELPDPVELVSPALAETLQGVTPDELAEVRTRAHTCCTRPTPPIHNRALSGRCSTSRRGAACSAPPIASASAPICRRPRRPLRRTPRRGRC